jgi:WD40 repeat protein
MVRAEPAEARLGGSLRCGAGVQALCVLALMPRERSPASEAFAAARVVACGDAAGALTLWDSETRRAVARRAGAHCARYGVLALREAGVGRLLSQGRDGWVRCWAWAVLCPEAAPLWELRTGSQGFARASVAGGVLACASDDANSINVWGLPGRAGDGVGEGEGEGAAAGADGFGELAELLADVGISGAAPGALLVPPPRDVGAVGMCMDLALASSGDGSADGSSLPQVLMLIAMFENGSLYCYDLRAREWCEDVALALLERVPISLDIVTSTIVGGGIKVRGVACGVSWSLAAFSLELGSVRRRARVVKTVRLKKAATSGSSEQHQQQQELEAAEEEQRVGFSQVCVAPNSRVLACAGWDGTVRLVDWHHMTLLAVLKQHAKNARAVAFSDDSELLVSGSEDAHVALWKLPSLATAAAVVEASTLSNHHHQHPTTTTTTTITSKNIR